MQKAQPARKSSNIAATPSSTPAQPKAVRAQRTRKISKRFKEDMGGPVQLNWVMKQCQQILKALMTHKYGWPFNQPVDPVLLCIPDYFDVIKHPMDLGTVKV